MVKADANESPYRLPEAKMAELFSRIAKAGLNRYPESHDAVKAGLALYTGLAPADFICGNGSDELIAMTVLALARGGKVAVPAPTFGMYAVCAQNYGGKAAAFPCDENLDLDLAAFADFANAQKADLTVLCSPNNPTGQAFERTEVGRFIGAVKGIVVLDEAYSEFSNTSCIDLVKKYSNLVVLRTLSKAFGMAGVRFGYLAAAPELLARIEAVRQVFNLGVMPLLAAEVALSDISYMKETVEKLTAERERMGARLAKLTNVKAKKSATNFILLRCRDEKELAGILAMAGVTVRTYREPELAGCVRVTVGEPAQNDAVLSILEDYDEKRNG
ncbi:MAG TPA: histidinol-phosphate transaminase [Terriglobales bacterium]|nr:histidinol-phosphate transaminase [Terriglobales bacterium]